MGRLYADSAKPKGGGFSSALGYFGFYLMMSFAPWAHLRVPDMLGGNVFGGMIIYRFVTNTALFVLASGQFSAASGVEMVAGDARMVYRGGAVCARLAQVGILHQQADRSRVH